ncbi:polysaccharide biosynthesis tyrosine autokinase [uncultured Pontibacter sp.]|uniref:GumC family protein n=1 Tax=uncultured Pontibacter sp. TaxID=453356 RepID=UPI002637E2E4|nr:polysaccharide biosynthesis tyrosine autokinase [uncultured Pontibacter sp.]
MSNDKDIVKKEEDLLTILVYRFLPFWPLFLVLLVLALAGAYGYMRYVEPSYEVSATLIIKDENKGVDDPQMTEAINAFTSKKIVENEIEVIQSKSLMKKVVHKLNLYAPVLEERDFRDVSAYLSSPITVKHQDPESLIRVVKDETKVYFTYDKDKVIVDNKEYNLNEWVMTPYGKIQFIKNKHYQKSAEGPLFFSLVPPQYMTENLMSKLEVNSANKLSTVVSLSMRDEVPERGEDILNQLIHSYHQVAVNEKSSLADNTLRFIEERINFVEDELNTLESKVQQYKSSKGIVDLSEQGKVYLQSVGENDRRMEDLKMQIAVLDKVESYVVSKSNSAGIVPATLGLNDPVLSELLQKLYDSEIEYQRLRKTTAQNNPILLSLHEKIERVRPSILENIQSQRQNLQASLGNLASSRGKYSTTLQSIPKQERELLEISRQQAIKNSVYSYLLQKREEAALSYAPASSDSKVVDMAEASLVPVSPKKNMVYAVAVVVALMLGIGLVIGKELLSQKVLFRSDIESFTKAPIVGEISNVKGKIPARFQEPTEVYITEQFRQLRTSMGLYGRGFAKKKILVVSSIPGEGKSFVSSNLAYSLAASGKRVVLLDLDLRKPNTSYRFNLIDEIGITEYLVGEVSASEIVRDSPFANLSVVPAGKNTGDNTELLLNGKLEDLFAYMETVFDYVIVDSSPTDLVSDAFLISEFCDITLLVIRHDYTPKNVIKHLNHNIRLSSLKSLAIVFNGVKARGFGQGNYGFGYGYGHERVYKQHAYKS